MDANEQRARELLWRAEQSGGVVVDVADMRAIAKALAQQVPADGEAPCVVCGFGRNGAQHSRADSYLDARGMYHDYTPQAPQPVVDYQAEADALSMSMFATRADYEAALAAHGKGG